VQATVARAVAFSGIGLHSGVEVRMTVRPSGPGSGILFRRTDMDPAVADVPALWDRVVPWPLNTRIANAAGTAVATIEHLMAALAGMGICNALVEIDGPEVPILDGSAAGFLRGLSAAGRAVQPAPLRVIRVLHPVEVRAGEALARLTPAAGLHIAVEIDFPGTAIGRQALELDLAGPAFARELADCRTFTRLADVAAARAQGLALGGSLDNAVVVDGDRVLNPGGFRRPDEAVRHKMLDVLGDLATAGAPILGAYAGVKAGHALTNRLLRRLFATPGAWEEVAADAGILRRLPGGGSVTPAPGSPG
jgi:UDP-3-O-[3-hydroxymyristoyl] N-acetylglucosamine deacetylase